MTLKVTREEFIGKTYEELLAENAKLRDLMYERAHKHAIQHMTEDELRIVATNALDENAKLRELVCKVEHYERLGCHECPYEDGCEAYTLYDEECPISREIKRMKRELGFEVD